jgi:SpoVK/Ycf46/Vps4 family AAA+-type ATPase
MKHFANRDRNIPVLVMGATNRPDALDLPQEELAGSTEK